MDEENYQNIRLTLIVVGLAILATYATIIGFKRFTSEANSRELLRQTPDTPFYLKGYLGGVQGKSSTGVIKGRQDLKWRPDGTENGFKGGVSIGIDYTFKKVPVWMAGETTFFLENCELNKTAVNQATNIMLNKRIKSGFGFGVSGLIGIKLAGVKPYVRVGQEWVNTSFKVHAANSDTEAVLVDSGLHRSLSRTTLLIPAHVFGLGVSVPLPSDYSFGVELSQSVSKKTNAFRELTLEPIQIKKTALMIFVKRSF